MTNAPAASDTDRTVFLSLLAVNTSVRAPNRRRPHLRTTNRQPQRALPGIRLRPRATSMPRLDCGFMLQRFGYWPNRRRQARADIIVSQWVIVSNPSPPGPDPNPSLLPQPIQRTNNYARRGIERR